MVVVRFADEDIAAALGPWEMPRSIQEASMPTSEEILGSLGSIAQQWLWLAIVWHVVLVLFGLTWILGSTPTKRTFGFLGSLMLLSVSLLAWTVANPVNGLVFAVAAAMMLIFSVRMPKLKARIVSPGALGLGAMLIAFGWSYPHFLLTYSGVEYLYSAPLGLIPCPTLAAVMGIALVTGLFTERGVASMLVILGLFYGLFGALRLGVALDWVLFVGTLAFIAFAVSTRLKFARRAICSDRSRQASIKA